MDNKEQSKDIPSLEFDKDNKTDDYQYLLRKLKNIKKSISLLEKSFLEN